jgi:general secretion pathway protein H
MLYFSKKGYIDKTAIHLRDDDGRDMTIILSPFMGAARIFDSYVDLEDERARY